MANDSSYNDSVNDTATELCLPDFGQNKQLFEFAFDTVVVGIISLIGIVGNLLSIVTFSKFRTKTTTSVLLTALAVSDLLYLLVHGILFQFLRSIYPGTGVFREYYKNIWPYMEVYEYPFSCMFQTTSAWFVILVAVDRYLAICWPLQSRHWCTVKSALLQIIVISIAGVAMHMPRFFALDIIHKFDNCSESWVPQKHITPFGDRTWFKWTIGMLYLIFAYLLPILILTVVNVRLVIALQVSHKSHRKLISVSSTDSNEDSRNHRITAMLVVVVLVFLLCQIPQAVDHLFYTTSNFHWEDVDYYEVICNTLVIFNSAFNFFVYVLFGHKFRNSVKRLLCKERRRPSVTSATSPFPTTREKLDSLSSNSSLQKKRGSPPSHASRNETKTSGCHDNIGFDGIAEVTRL